MRIKTLLDKQKELDDFIYHRNKCTYNKEKTKLSLLVELGELCNETKCFKYWSNKEPNFEKIKEEYADCLHFALSLTYNENDSTYIWCSTLGEIMESLYSYSQCGIIDRTIFFNKVFYECSILNRVLQQILMLGCCLGLTSDEIIESYESKYKKNIERQNNGY